MPLVFCVRGPRPRSAARGRRTLSLLAVAAVAVPTTAVVAGSDAATSPPERQVSNEFTENQAKAFDGWGLSESVRDEKANAPSSSEIRESRDEHDGQQSAQSVRELVSEIAPSMLQSDAIVPPREMIEQPLSATVLQIKGKDGKPGGVVRSDLPLAIPTKKTKTNPRGLKVADLDFETDGSRIEVKGPAVPVSLPTAADGTAKFGDLAVSLAPDAASTTGSVTGEAVTYPNVDTDEDLVVRSTTVGFEASWLLRSPDADREIRIPVSVPDGGRLVLNDDKTVSIRDKDGDVVGRMTAPAASDAAKQRVPLDVAVDGDDVVITAAPDSETLWPVVVDPQFVAQYDNGSNAAAQADLANWKEAKSRGNIAIYTGKFDPRDDQYKLFGGLVINGYTGNYGSGTNQYLPGDFASWNRYSPGDQAGPDSRDPAWAPRYNSASQRYESNEHAFWWRFDIGGVNYQNNRGQSDPALGFGLLNANGSGQAGIKYQNQTSSGTFTNESYDPTVRSGGPVGYLNGTAGAGATIYSGTNRGDYTNVTVNPDNIAAMSIQDKGTLGGNSRGDTSGHMGWYRLYATDAFAPRITSPQQGMTAWSETAPSTINNVTAADHGVGVQLTGMQTDTGASLGSNLESCVPGSSGICGFYAPAHNYNVGQVAEGRRNYLLYAIDGGGNGGRQDVPLLVDRSTPKTAAPDSAKVVRPEAPSGSTAPRTINITASDDVSGVKSIVVTVDGVPTTVTQPACSGTTCPTSVPLQLPADKLTDGQHRVTVTVKDQVNDLTPSKPHTVTDAYTFTVLHDGQDPPRDPGTGVNLGRQPVYGLGFEDWWTYDSTDTGRGSTFRTNLSTGNASWSVTPVQNPGVGLNSFLRLTYNSYEPSGLLPNLLGGGNSGLGGYGVAGRGFSAQLAGVTRLNEPLEIRGPGGISLLSSVTNTNKAESILLTDGDGTEHLFTRIGSEQDAINSGTLRYKAPKGVHLTLRRFSSDTSDTNERFWAATRPDGTTYFFNRTGYATQVVERHGNQIRFTYEDSKRNPVCGFQLLCTKRVQYVTDSAGLNPSGLSGVSSDAATATTQRRWELKYDDASDRLTHVLDRKSVGGQRRDTELHYDSAGRLDRITEDSAGPAEQRPAFALGYDDTSTFLTKVTDPNGNSTNVSYGAATDAGPLNIGQLLGGVGLAPQTRRVDTVRDRASTGASSRTTTYGYATAADGSGATTITDARGVVDRVLTDDRGRLTEANEGTTVPEAVINPDRSARKTLQGWTDDNMVRFSTVGAADTATAVTTTYDWGELGELKSDTQRAGTETAANAPSRTESWTYRTSPGKLVGQGDTGGKFVYDVETAVDRRGKTTGYDYGTVDRDLGDVARITRQGAGAESFTYDTHGLVTSQTTEIWNKDRPKPSSGFNAAEGRTITDQSSPADQLLCTPGKLPCAVQTESSSGFDANGNATVRVDARGKTWKSTYDEVGNATSMADPRATGPAATSTPESSASTAASATSASGERVPGPIADVSAKQSTARTTGTDHVARWTYDALDRQVATAIPKNSSGSTDRFRVSATAFDLNDNVVQTLDGNGKVAKRDYTQTDQIKTDSTPEAPHYGTTATAAETTRYAYDGVDNLTERADPLGTLSSGGHRTTWAYNQFDEPVVQRRIAGSSSSPSQLTTSRSYDARGNVRSEVDANSNGAASDKDAAANAVDVSKQRQAYVWDTFDRLSTATENPSGGVSGNDTALITKYGYDNEDHLLTKTTPAGRSSIWEYDDAGWQTSQAEPFAYDQDARTTDTDPKKMAVTTVKRRADGLPYEMTAPRGNDDGGLNGFTTRMSYYPTGEMRSRALPRAAGQYGPEWHVDYALNDVGDPITVTDARGRTIDNTFLDSGELASTTRPSWWIYDQDANGVRERTDEDPKPGNSSGGTPSSDPTSGDFGAVEPQDLPDVLPAAGKTELSYDDELRLSGVTSRSDVVKPASNPGPASLYEIKQTLNYDPLGRLSARSIPKTDSTSIGLTWQYDPNGNVRQQTDGENQSTTYDYDDYDRLTAQSTPANCSSGCSRPTTTQRYDANGNVTDQVLPAAGDADNTATGGTTGKAHTDYDAVDRPISTVDPSGSTTSQQYDPDGLVVKSYAPRAALTPVADRERYATNYVRDGGGRVTKQSALAVDGSTSQSLITTTQYDRDGNATRVESPGAAAAPNTDPVSRVQVRGYDGRDLPWFTTIGTGDDKRTTITEYDGNGWLRRTVNPRGVDDSGALPVPRESDDPTAPSGGLPNRNAETLEYSDDGQLTARNLPWGDGDSASATASAERWRQDFVYSPRGVSTEITGIYDKKGDRSGSKDRETTVVSNRAGWPIKTTSHDAGNTDQDVSFSYDYDNQGNQTLWDAAAGRRVTRGFFPSGQQAYRCGVRNSGSGTSEEQIYSYRYDQSGALSSVIDWAHNQVSDNTLCRQRAATGADSSTSIGTRETKVKRDKAGRPSTVTETWDGGKQTTYDYTAGTPNLLDTVKTDRLKDTDGTYKGGSSTAYAYDSQDRNTKVTVSTDTAANKPADRVTDLQWWPSGDRQQITKPKTDAGQSTTERRFYDTAGLVTRRTVTPADGSGDQTTTYAYDKNANRTQDERGDNTYNARDQQVTWTRKRNGKTPAATTSDPIKSTTYRVDGSGRQVGTTQKISIDSPETAGQFDYGKVETTIVSTNKFIGDRLDSTNRSIKVTKTDNAPPAGALKAKDDYQTDCYAYGAMGSQTLAVRKTASLDNGADDPKIACQAVGSRQAGSGWRTENQNTYDTFERLVASRQRDHGDDTQGTGDGTLGKNEAYCYDGLDRRDRRLTNLDTSQDPGENDDNQTAFQKARAACSQQTVQNGVGVQDFSYLGLTQQLTRENRASGVQTYEYAANGQRLGRLKAEPSGAPKWRSYDTDAQGSVVGLESPSTGKVADNDRYDTDPYGDPVKPDSALSDDAKSNPFQFQGFYKDQATGNYDMQARTYRPSVGQFLQQDRFADPQADLALASDPLTSSRYAFTAGNPSSRAEYDGHFAPDQTERSQRDASDRKVIADSHAQGQAAPSGTVTRHKAFRAHVVNQEIYAALTGKPLYDVYRRPPAAAKATGSGLVSSLQGLGGAIADGFNAIGEARQRIVTGLVTQTAADGVRMFNSYIRPSNCAAAGPFETEAPTCALFGFQFGDPSISSGSDRALDAASLFTGGSLREGAIVAKSISPTIRELQKEGLTDAHHIIQDAAVRDVDGYKTLDAPGVQLPGRGRDTPHGAANRIQRTATVGGTYGAERAVACSALRAAGCSQEQIRDALERADNYFMGQLGLTHQSPLRIPGNRRGVGSK